MKKLTTILLIIFTLFSFLEGVPKENLVKSASQDVWPMFGYNAQHTRQSPYDTSTNSSSPAIASDGTIHTGSKDNPMTQSTMSIGELHTSMPAPVFTDSFEDNFSTDTGMWSYKGSAYRDSQNNYIVLTENKDNQAGVVWFKQDIYSPFNIEFKFKCGGGSGADGMVFMFYKKKDYDPSIGGSLGFIGPGYGVEFDNFKNSEFNEPSENHIAIIKDNVSNHLIFKDDSRTEDNQWHNAKIIVKEFSIEVYVDSALVLNWSGTIDRSYGGLGFGGGTGSFNNWHIIDDARITVPSQNPNKPPRGLRAYPGDKKVLLQWDPPEDTTNLAGYYIYRAKTSGGYASPAHDFPITNTSYTDENVENGVTYYYICKAVYKDKTQSPPSNEVVVTPKAPSLNVNIEDNKKVNTSSFTFTGKVDIGCEVYVNGNKVNVDANGNFSVTVSLNKGTNTIKIEVKNKLGDVTTITKTVTYEESGTGTSNLIIVLRINDPYMTVNGVKKEIDPGRGTVPVIVKGRTLVPIRAIIEEMGGSISWDGTERKVTITLKNTKIELWIDKKSALVNGATKELDVEPQIINSRTMIPLRFVTENLGCNVQWDGDTKTITITYNKEGGGTTQGNTYDIGGKLVAQEEKVIGPSGGEIVLSDGTKLTIPQNALSENTKVTLLSVNNPTLLGTNSKGFELKGLQNLKGEITLTFTVEKGLSNDEISIFGYNPQNDNVFKVSSNYESSAGKISVKLSPTSLPTTQSTSPSDCGSSLLSFTSPTKPQGIIDRFRILFEKTESYVPKNSECLIQMPYYGQIGNGCWATSTTMLIRGYSGSQGGEPFSSILSYMKVDDSDYGVGLLSFTELLPGYIRTHTNGKNVTWRGFTSFQHIQWEILRQIEAGRHPILFKYYGHVVLIIGFRNYGRELIIHDPQNINPPNETNGTMYTIRSENWLKERMSFTRANQIMWISEPLTTPKTLQTIECAGGDESGGNPYGEILFYNINPKITDKDRQKVPVATLRLKPSISFGYRWENKGESIDVIPSDAIGLKMKLPIWNASFEDKNLIVKTQINADVTNKLFYNEKTISVKRASYNSEARGTYEIEIPLEDVRNVAYGDKQGKQKATIFEELYEGNTVKDSFVIDATLYLIPKVVSVEPNTGKTGDTITIKGYAFGKKKSSKSKVMIGDKVLDINKDVISWSDKEIKVKLPDGIQGGPVVVYTGEKYQYESNKDIIFNAVAGVRYFNIFGYRSYWDIHSCQWGYYPQRSFDLNIILEKGEIKAYKLPNEGAYQDVSGTYDNENVYFHFVWKDLDSDMHDTIISGDFVGKLVKEEGSIYYKIYGTATCKVREYDKNPYNPCRPYDVEKEFKTTMEGQEFYP